MSYIWQNESKNFEIFMTGFSANSHEFKELHIEAGGKSISIPDDCITGFLEVLQLQLFGYSKLSDKDLKELGFENLEEGE